ncbi:MAG: fumarylacetoacetate hydrolase family protein [Actinobacteria bacterium]|nr:fumarylacetoacetate hydrolase family protein [Actinomycetota bacterium]
MRWATYRHADSEVDRVGLVIGDEVYGLSAGTRLLDLLRDDALAEAGDRAGDDPAEVVPLGDVRLRAPIPQPPTVRDFYAFEEHVRTAREARGLEMDPDWYELPVFYFSNPHRIVGPGDEVAVPPGCEALDFELEVAAIVGRGGSDLAPETASSHIAGFTVMNDWSARDLQKREMALHLGPAKGKDFATTLGPFLVTPDEIAGRAEGHAYDLEMTASVNGERYSLGSLADLYWSFGQMLAYASRGARIEPGDVIGSGTVGTGCILELSLVHGSDRYPWLEPGDEVTLEVDALGAITNRVVEGPDLIPLRL